MENNFTISRKFSIENCTNKTSNFFNRPTNRLAETQKKVDEVVSIMGENIEVTRQRGEKLQDLEETCGALEIGASQFQQGTVKLKQKHWWQNMRYNLIIGGIVLAVVVVVLIIIFA